MDLTASLGCPDISLSAAKTPAKTPANLVFEFIIISSKNYVDHLISINELPTQKLNFGVKYAPPMGVSNILPYHMGSFSCQVLSLYT